MILIRQLSSLIMIDESSIFVHCDLSSSCPSPCPHKAEEHVKPITGFGDFKYHDICMSSIPVTFYFEAPAFRRVGLLTLPPVNQAMMASALIPPPATFAPSVDCNPVPYSASPAHIARDFTSEGLFNSTQEVSIANLRAFAHGLKNNEKRRYEGVSAAEESKIRGAQFRTLASAKSKEKAYTYFMNEMENTKIYKSLGSIQKNPSFDPRISYNFVPELEFGIESAESRCVRK
jgi:hypothetical protein